MGDTSPGRFASDTPPTRVGRYHVLEPLGRGAWGDVYACYDPVLDRRVALKLLRVNLSADTQQVLARFQNEVRVLGRLSHPNVVGVFDAGTDGDRPFLVMEFCPGPALQKLLVRVQRLPPGQAVWVAREVVTALTYLHDLQIVHRDIKPSNLMFHGERLKLTDFGVVHTEFSELTVSGEAVGTPAYMAPEQVLGETIDARIDVYALGVLIFRMLAGRVPFEGQPHLQMYQTVYQDRPIISSIVPDLPPGFDGFFERALARQPHDRFGSATELYAALLELVPPETVRPVEMPAELLTAGHHPLEPMAERHPGPVSAPMLDPRTGDPRPEQDEAALEPTEDEGAMEPEKDEAAIQPEEGEAAIRPEEAPRELPPQGGTLAHPGFRDAPFQTSPFDDSDAPWSQAETRADTLGDAWAGMPGVGQALVELAQVEDPALEAPTSAPGTGIRAAPRWNPSHERMKSRGMTVR